MESLKNKFSKIGNLIELAILLLFLVVVALNGIAIMDKNFEYMIGYLDTMTKISSFDRIIDGEVPYKDFVYHLGPLLLYFQVPLYILLGQNHFAALFILFVILPAISVLLIYLWAKIFLKTYLNPPVGGSPKTYMTIFAFFPYRLSLKLLFQLVVLICSV